MKNDHAWLQQAEQHFSHQGRQGGMVILFPQYRPEWAEALAHHFDLAFFDYRARIMLPMGWEAAQIPLEDMLATLKIMAERSGLVAYNVEALLATKTDQQRQTWLQAFLNEAWPHPVLLPLSIYQADAPADHPRVCDLQQADFPEASLLLQLKRINSSLA